MRQKKSTMLIFIGPAVLLFVVFFCYPVLKTLAMSVFSVRTVSSSLSTWKFSGLENFRVLRSTGFVRSLKTLMKIWFECGIVVFVMAMLFAVLLTSGMRLKGFFRSMLYLPNVIPQLAIGYMWTLYVFSSRFGLMKKMALFFGWDRMAEFGWTSPDHMFLSMCIAYVFSNVGYFTLMYMAAIESIPKSLYEAATIDGANGWKKLYSITVPLIRNTLISSITIWTSRVCAFFALSRVFEAAATVTPLMYIYDVVFGSESGKTDAGVGAAAAVVLTAIVVVVFLLSNLISRNTDVEL